MEDPSKGHPLGGNFLDVRCYLGIQSQSEMDGDNVWMVFG